jgi:transposase InsO family protein
VRHWSQRTQIVVKNFIGWLNMVPSKYYDWRQRYGQANEHHALVPRDHGLEDWEKQAILDFHRQHPLEGYRRLAFMMLDRDLVATSPSSVYHVLKEAGRLARWNPPSKKGTGFVQPLAPHEHGHVDIAYINVCGTFYYLCSLLDGASRYIVHWEIRASMKEFEVELVLQRAREAFPGVTPRIVSDHPPRRTVHSQGLQGIHPAVRDDARAHQSVLPAEQRQAGALARLAQTRVHPAGGSAQPGRRAATGEPLCRTVQHGALAQRDRLRHAAGPARWPAAHDLG